MNLVFAAHCHQPLGNFDEVVAEACDLAYLPFLEVLGRHPDLRVNLHYSGSLLEWLDGHRPDVIDALQDRDDQIEWVGGAFYEPILPSIPSGDALAQISLLTDFLHERFGQTPRGAWIAERVWDPSLAALLNEAGLEYTLLDDYAFLLAGYPPNTVTESFVTDHQGKTLTIFPIAQELRYAVPGSSPAEVVDLLRIRHELDQDMLAVIADDGEKYGLWPNSSEQVYAPGNWLDEFLTLVEETPWIESTTFARHLDEKPAARQVAIPPASYREMSEWSLPAATPPSIGPGSDQPEYPDWVHLEAVMRGGWWPNFVIEYPEAAVLYRKMLRTSAHLAAGKGPAEAQAELLKAQCNDAYWHGAFGGLYAPHLRARANQHLIAAQTLIDAHHHRGRAWTYLRHVDWDADLREEIEVQLPDQAWVVDPAGGGCLLYFDDKPSRWSIGDVVARHFEPYHADLDKLPTCDRHPRRWLIDHLLPSTTTAESFAQVTYEELVSLSDSPYAVVAMTEGRGSARIEMTALDGAIGKRIEAEERTLRIGYEISGVPAGRIGPEMPIAVWEGAGQIRVDGGSWQAVDEPLALAGHRFRFRHDGLKTSILVVLRQPGTIFSIPIRTATRDDSGTSSIMQGIVLWPHWSTGGDGSYDLSVEVVADAVETT